MPSVASVSEVLGSLSAFWILGLVAAASVLRLALIRADSYSARPWADMLETGLVVGTFFLLIIRPFAVQAFFIPSASMEPTLLGNNGTGDRILVNKFDYRLHPPRRGDVVVFLAPPEATVPDGLPPDVDFIKRLIGLPGDRLEVVGGVVYANGEPYNHAAVRQALARAGEFGPDAQGLDYVSQADHHVKFVANGVLADTHLVGLTRLGTVLTGMPHAAVRVAPGYLLRGGRKISEPFVCEDPDYDLKIFNGKPLKRAHGILDDPVYRNACVLQGQAIPPADFKKDWSRLTEPLPAGRFLMMGDNRNDSSDGTQWGTLAARRVVGRAQCVFWPLPRLGAIH